MLIVSPASSLRRRSRLVAAVSPEPTEPAGTSFLPSRSEVESHAYAVALHMMYYNFVRIHRSLKVTPAKASGVTDRFGRSAILSHWSKRLKRSW